MYVTARATEAATCAACISCTQLGPPTFIAFSGTTTVSPPLSVAFMGSPIHHPEPLFFAEITDPSAPITNTAFLSANGVKPPAWLSYHFAESPRITFTLIPINPLPSPHTH